MHLKTLLYESVNACQALDEIDCDAWKEFSVPCKKNLIEAFEVVDFGDHEQCTFVSKSCGGAGPFPAFRRLDCGDELEAETWQFYKDYKKSCLGGDLETNTKKKKTTMIKTLAPAPVP